MKVSPLVICLSISLLLQIGVVFAPLDAVNLNALRAMQFVALVLTAYAAWEVYRPTFPPKGP
jgi:hypothetical protein